MALSVKSYLNFESDSPEIRRFSIPEDVGANYEYLVEKIRRVYPSLLRKDFKLYWRDDEDELVAFSSNDELIIALESNYHGNFRVYIKEHDSTDGTSGGKKEKHPGVVCDVCDREIEGTRFKCLACPDYDLCSNCEGKGFHSEHEMLRIRTPTKHPWQGIWHMVFGPRGGHGGRGCHMRGRHGGRPCHPPPWGHFPRGRGCWGPPGCPWQAPSGDAAQKPSEEEGKKNEEKQETSESSSAEQQMPTFEQIFSQVSEVARQFMNPEQFNAWGFDGDNHSTEPKDVPIRKEEEMVEDEGKGAAEDTPMQSESFVVVDKNKDEMKDSAPSERGGGQRRREEEEFERRLDEAIKQMESMGFNNDNGWLTQLLIAKDFDIGRVIDTLQLKQN